jgi:proteasome-associated ATPase
MGRTCEETLQKAKEIIQKQKEILDGLGGGIREIHYVISKQTREDGTFSVGIARAGGVAELPISKQLFSQVFVGSGVYVNPEVGVITGLVDENPAYEVGLAVRIEKNLGDGKYQVSRNGITQLVVGENDALKPNQTVVLDPGTGMFIIDVLDMETADAKTDQDEFAPTQWDDIGGLEMQKQAIRESIEDQFVHQDILAAYGKAPVKGILLFGPPGCGKTMLASAAATMIKKLAKTGNALFQYVKGPEILNMYVGASEERIRNLFATAREHENATGDPSVIFIDEAESILKKRGSGISSDVENTIVPAFLSEWDGLKKSKTMVILATNRADMLDSAVTRDSRVDIKLHVPRPNKETCTDILGLNLENVPINEKGSGPKSLAKLTLNEVCKESHSLYKVRTESEEHMFGLKDLITGAMLKGIVQKGITEAIRRDRSSGTLSGIKKADMRAAVRITFEQNKNLDHTDNLRDFQESLNSRITRITRIA